MTGASRTPAQDAAVDQIRSRYDATPELERFEIHDWPDGQVVVVVVPQGHHRDLPAIQYHVWPDGRVQQES